MAVNDEDLLCLVDQGGMGDVVDDYVSRLNSKIGRGDHLSLSYQLEEPEILALDCRRFLYE